MEAFDPSYDTRHFHTFATNHLLTAHLMMRYFTTFRVRPSFTVHFFLLLIVGTY